MPAKAATATNGRQEAPRLYRELEDRMLARDQVGGSRIYYELLRRGRPLPEIMAEAVRIHAPYKAGRLLARPGAAAGSGAARGAAQQLADPGRAGSGPRCLSGVPRADGGKRAPSGGG